MPRSLSVAGIFVLALLSGCAAVDRTETKTVSAPLVLLPGDVVQLDVTRTKRRTKGGKVVRDDTYQSTQRIEFIAADAEGFRATITSVSATATSTDKRLEAQFRAGSAAFIGRTIALTTDPTGAPIRVDDWQELLAEIRGAANGAFVAETPVEARAMVNQMLDAFLDMDEAAAAARLAKNLTYWSNLHDFELNVGEPVAFEGQAAHPFGGPSLTFDSTLTLASAGSETAIIEIEQVLPEGELVKVVDTLIDLLKLPANQYDKLRAQLKAEDSSMTIAERYEVDLKTGWTTRVEITTNISIGRVLNEEEQRVIVATRAR